MKAHFDLMMAENNSNRKGKCSINDWACAACNSNMAGWHLPPRIHSRCASVRYLGRAEPAASAQASAAQDALLFFWVLTFLCDSKHTAVGIPDFAEASVQVLLSLCTGAFIRLRLTCRCGAVRCGRTVGEHHWGMTALPLLSEAVFCGR